MHLFICGKILAWHKKMGTNRSHAPTPPYVPAPRVVGGFMLGHSRQVSVMQWAWERLGHWENDVLEQVRGLQPPRTPHHPFLLLPEFLPAVWSRLWFLQWSRLGVRVDHEHWRIDAFELWCWRRLLRVPWTARRSNQTTLKEISREYSLEGLMLKLQYFGHLMQRTDSLEKTLVLGKIEGRRRRGRQRMRWLDGITD